MSTLKLMLGLIPSTSKIEQEEKALIAELEKMISFASSATLARYNELHESVNSASFKQKRREIESLTYKGSEEYAREKECLSLKKAKDIVLYFKTEGSQPLKNFISLDGSSKIKEIEDLERYIQSPEFRMKEKMKPITFKNTEEYGKWLEYKKLKSDKEVRKNLNPDKVRKYEELKMFVTSAAFLVKKNMKPVTFKDTPEYQKLLEFRSKLGASDVASYYKFKASKELANYLQVKDSARLKRLAELNITGGCGGSNYCPEGLVTREQMAAFIVRAVAGEPALDYCGGVAPFQDVAPSTFFFMRPSANESACSSPAATRKLRPGGSRRTKSSNTAGSSMPS